jgi:hypothetical protein
MTKHFGITSVRHGFRKSLPIESAISTNVEVHILCINPWADRLLRTRTAEETATGRQGPTFQPDCQSRRTATAVIPAPVATVDTSPTKPAKPIRVARRRRPPP